MKILVVQPHEGQLNAREFALGNVGLGGRKAQFADLLPIGIGRGPGADTGYLEDFGADIVLCRGNPRAEAAHGSHAADGGSALQQSAAAHRHSDCMFEPFNFHENLPSFIR
ncbi:MAG: hypothetical protein U1A06_20120, partial [Hoeflea sp.]|nr:hypothetical protein [Hoeflea sp.]